MAFLVPGFKRVKYFAFFHHLQKKTSGNFISLENQSTVFSNNLNIKSLHPLKIAHEETFVFIHPCSNNPV